MSSLATLLREVRACTLCAAHLPHGPRPVLQLDPDARILVAAQAPGRKVHASGMPFTDASGDRLRDWMGVDKETFYDPKQIAIIPMGFCYPGTTKAGDSPPRAECAPAWRSKLLSHLKHLELTIVVGQYALAWHLPEKGASVTKRVEHWQDQWPHIVPLPHPSPRNNRWLQRNPWFEKEVIPALRARVREILNPRIPAQVER